METLVTQVQTSGIANCVPHLRRFYTPLIRACLLNLVAQIALGTPVAAQGHKKLPFCAEIPLILHRAK